MSEPRSALARRHAASAGRIALGVLVLSALGWQLLPLVVWHLHLHDRLASQPHGERIEVPFLADFGEAPPHWRRLEVGPISLVAPLAGEPVGCASEGERCRVELTRGLLHVVPFRQMESYEQMVLLRAPDRRDLGWLRRPQANWATMRALRLRVETARGSLDSFRFTTPGATGVGARTVRAGVARYLISAYSPSGRTVREVALGDVSHEVFLQVLGSIAVREP